MRYIERRAGSYWARIAFWSVVLLGLYSILTGEALDPLTRFALALVSAATGLALAGLRHLKRADRSG